MIEYKQGNLLAVDRGIIVHGCNAQGVMGSGVALAVKNKYPQAFAAYKEQLAEASGDTLGSIFWACIFHNTDYDRLFIANAITQNLYGKTGDKFVSYDAVDKCMLSLNMQNAGLPIHMPKIGAGLGGGKWEVIEEIIKHRITSVPVTVWVL